MNFKVLFGNPGLDLNILIIVVIIILIGVPIRLRRVLISVIVEFIHVLLRNAFSEN